MARGFLTDNPNYQMPDPAPPDPEPPAAVVGTIQSLLNANPSILSMGLADFNKFANGDSVTFAGTGKSIDGTSAVLSGANAAARQFTLATVDLSAEAAPIATGTVTKPGT